LEPDRFPDVVGYNSSGEHLVAKKPKKLEDLFHETLKDIYFELHPVLLTPA